MVGHFAIFVPDVLFEIQDTVTKFDKNFDFTKEEVTANLLLLILRLIKSQPIGIACTYWKVPEQPFLTFTEMTNSKIFSPLDYMGEPYVLIKDDLQKNKRALAQS